MSWYSIGPVRPARPPKQRDGRRHPHRRRRIREIEVPEHCVGAAVIRDEEFVVPRGDTELLAGDHVVLVGPREEVKAAQDVFTGTPAGARG